MTVLVYPQFEGRLGNCLFQIAAAIGYAKHYDCEWAIHKGYMPVGFAKFSQIDTYFPELPATRAQFKSYLECPPDTYCPIHGVGFDYCHFNYHHIPFHPKGVKLVGFWQTEKYFANARDEVLAAFALQDYPELRDYVSVHIRLGDYVQAAHIFPPVDAAYLAAAMDKFPQALANRKFLVFSDDIALCKQVLGPLATSVVYSDGRNEYDDLCMMASCGHNIIANSSFSWWAAWLNRSPGRIVVAPSHKRGNWFGLGAGVKNDLVDLLPDSWRQIEFR